MPGGNIPFSDVARKINQKPDKVLRTIGKPEDLESLVVDFTLNTDI